VSSVPRICLNWGTIFASIEAEKRTDGRTIYTINRDKDQVTESNYYNTIKVIWNI